MSEAMIVALIGGAAGLITALTAVFTKISEAIKARRGETLEKKIGDTVKPIMDNSLKPIMESQLKLREDVTRIRLLDLIRHEPKDAENILIVGKMYFDGFHGNSEASKQFSRWLKQENIKKPEWFNPKKAE